MIPALRKAQQQQHYHHQQQPSSFHTTSPMLITRSSSRFSPIPQTMQFVPETSEFQGDGSLGRDYNNHGTAPSPLTVCSEVSDFPSSPCPGIHRPTPRHLSKPAPTTINSTPLRRKLNKNAVPFEFVPIGSPEKRNTNNKHYKQYHDSPHYGKSSPAPTVDTAWETVGSTSTSPVSGSPISAFRASPVSWRHGTPTQEVEEVRQTRIKTELCMHYVNSRPCPFGAQCTYAHGEEELQLTKLLDWHEAGLVDVATYRTKPCLTWIMTGSCPFGKRCTSIHDPRVAGLQPSWLPHTETQGNSIATDINVEALHQKRLFTLLHGTPFGEQFDLENDNWNDLYRLVCHMDVTKQSGWKERRSRPNSRSQSLQLDPMIKLQIALMMRGKDSDWQYKYRPGHVIYDELCMVLQQRAFIVEKSGNVKETSLRRFSPKNPNMILAREIAFGPDADPSVRGNGLYFHIYEQQVQFCTPQQAKRFRWKKGLVKNKDDPSYKNGINSKQASIFDSLDRFPMVRPHDAEAYELTTQMMQHRLNVLRAERIEGLDSRFERLERLKESKEELQTRFKNIKRSWVSWAWPVNNGREVVDKHTPVPPIDGEYKIRSFSNDDEEDSLVENTEPQLGQCVDSIWTSFISYTSDALDVSSLDESDEESWSAIESGNRLKVFAELSEGTEIASDRTLPLLPSMEPQDTIAKGLSDSERCWRSLLMQGNAYRSLASEWDIVHDHFNKSRSKKVLDIIQKKD